MSTYPTSLFIHFTFNILPKALTTMQVQFITPKWPDTIKQQKKNDTVILQRNNYFFNIQITTLLIHLTKQ